MAQDRIPCSMGSDAVQRAGRIGQVPCVFIREPRRWDEFRRHQSGLFSHAKGARSQIGFDRSSPGMYSAKMVARYWPMAPTERTYWSISAGTIAHAPQRSCKGNAQVEHPSQTQSEQP